MTIKIIAEIGSNFRTLEECLYSIGQANVAGADYVKFQAYNTKALYGFECGELPGELPIEWLPKLKEKANACGIGLLCSAFSPELVEAVDPYVEVHKIASAEMSHVRMLETLARAGKPVILSTGAHGPTDIARALVVLAPVPVTLLYCVASYPAYDIDFRMLESLKQFGKPVGFSDHTLDYLTIPCEAVRRGAVVIEKHMTAIDANTLDRPHSLTVDQFKRMVDAIHGRLPFEWGSGSERDMILKHNRRLIVTKPVKSGETFEEAKNFGIYRSLKADERGLSPWVISRVHGKVASRDMQVGEAIGPGDFT